MNPDARSIVEAGYDAMADKHLSFVGQIKGDPRLRFLAELTMRLRPGSQVVDLGCGAGEPSTRILTEQHAVVGVDVSTAQLRLATKHAPRAKLVRSDIATFQAQDHSLDAVTAFYSMTHVPRTDHARVFADVARWLRVGGLFLLTLSAKGETDGVQDDFLGVPMYFSGFGPEENRHLLETAGFDLLIDEIVEMEEPGFTASFHWVLAQKV